MNQQDYTGYIHCMSEQAQSHGQVHSGSEKAQSSSTSMAVQMLKNKNNRREEIKPVDEERHKVELEKSLESIRRFNQINEEIKESYDKQDAKLNKEKKMCVSHCGRQKQNTFQIYNCQAVSLINLKT